MNISEKQLEDLMIEDECYCIEKGVIFHAVTIRQFYLREYGIVDLLSYTIKDNKLLIMVTELKICKLSYNELGQLCRYMTGVREIFTETAIKYDLEIEIHGQLIGSSLDDSSDFLFFLNTIHRRDKNPIINLFTFNFGIRGLLFNKINSWQSKEPDHSKNLTSIDENVCDMVKSDKEYEEWCKSGEREKILQKLNINNTGG